jgi:peptide/nickel transport system substrate-binding protein
MTATMARPIERRQFIGLSAGALAAAAAGCGRTRDRADSRGSKVIIAYSPSAEGPFGLGAPSLLFLSLVRFTERGDLEGRLARSWAHSADFRSWTYHLRTDVRWHDGVPVTAHDVKFTLELLSRPESESFLPFESIEVLDDWTVTVRSARVADYYQTHACWPKHLLERLDARSIGNWEFWTRPVGNGPYRYLRQVPDTMAELEANPNYYRGKPRIDRVVLKFQAGLTDLLSGNVDTVFGNTVRSPLAELDPRIRVYYFYEETTARGIYWQNQHPFFRDPRVRRALTLAINRRELLPLINVPRDVVLVDGPYTQRQLRRGQIPAPLPYDPDQARALLDAAGWRNRDGDGVRERDGQAFRFAAIVFQPPYPSIALYVQDQFRRVGVHMDLQPLDDLVVEERLQRGAFEAAFASVWRSRWLLDKHSSIRYENPAFFALFQRAKETADPDEQDRIYRQLAAIVRADAPVTFLCPKVNLELVHRRVRGLSSPWRAAPLEVMDDLWLDDPGG